MVLVLFRIFGKKLFKVNWFLKRKIRPKILIILSKFRLSILVIIFVLPSHILVVQIKD
jgi:hypothetical protein